MRLSKNKDAVQHMQRSYALPMALRRNFSQALQLFSGCSHGFETQDAANSQELSLGLCILCAEDDKVESSGRVSVSSAAWPSAQLLVGKCHELLAENPGSPAFYQVFLLAAAQTLELRAGADY